MAVKFTLIRVDQTCFRTGGYTQPVFCVVQFIFSLFVMIGLLVLFSEKVLTWAIQYILYSCCVQSELLLLLLILLL